MGTDPKRFHARILYMAGGSYAWAPTEEQAIADVLQIFSDDWSDLVGTPTPGAKLPVNIWDTEGYPKACVSDMGAYVDKTQKEPLPADRHKVVRLEQKPNLGLAPGAPIRPPVRDSLADWFQL